MNTERYLKVYMQSQEQRFVTYKVELAIFG